MADETWPVRHMQRKVDPLPILSKMRQDKQKCEKEIMHLWNHATKVAQKEPTYPWKILDQINAKHKKSVSVLEAYMQDDLQMQEEIQPTKTD
jgi:hypothetical protein